MIKANFHTHTYRCNHAGCSDQRYVDVAVEAGIKVLGFSDHTPYVGFKDDFYSFYRMRPELLEEYVSSVNSLKEQYKDKIEIHLGLETEYYPQLFPNLLEFLKPYGIEYMILGQHYLDDDQYGVSVYHVNTEADMIKYVDQCIEGLETGLFSYLAHPDICAFDRSHPAFKREMTRLCRRAKELNIPLELNLLGILRERAYPCEEFLEICKECENTMIIGVDAHLPDQFLDEECLSKGLALIEKYSLRVTDEIDMTRLGRAYETNS